MDLPRHSIGLVDQVRVLDHSRTWPTKSGGTLKVSFAISFDEVRDRFFNYQKEELDNVPVDIRGLRAYTVRKLPVGKVGGTEWHKIREEMVFSLEGSVEWVCEDLAGGRREIMLENGVGVWMPPYILHSYTALKEDSGLFVLANTLFPPDNSAAHDTYPEVDFRQLQEKFRQTQ